MTQTTTRASPASIWSAENPSAHASAWSQPALPDPAKITFGLRQKDGTAACADVIAKMSSGTTTPALVSAYAEALRSLPPSSGERAAELQKALVPALLNVILVRSPEETPSADTSSPQRLARLNAGALLGELFLHRYLQGDGLLVAQRILSSAEVVLASQFAAVCNLAEPCSVDVDAPSAGSFWITVANVAASHSDPAVRTTLAERLTRYLNFIISSARRASKSRAPDADPKGTHDWTSESDGSEESHPTLPLAHATGNNNSVGTAPTVRPIKAIETTDRVVSEINTVANGRATNDADVAATSHRNEVPAVRRTVFISDIQDDMTPHALKIALDEFGVALKIRIVQGSKSFMGYCEMATEAAARAMTARGRTVVGTAYVRFQTVKNPITGSDPSDADVDADGVVIAPCTFGRSIIPFSANTKVRNAPRGKHASVN